MSELWYVGVNGQQQGPFVTQHVIDQIRAGAIQQTAYVYGQTLPAWTPISQVPVFVAAFAPPAQHAPPPPPQNLAPVADEIDFTVGGADLQYVEIVLDPGEAAIAEGTALFFMDPGIRMEGADALTAFGNGARERQRVAFAPRRAAKVVPVDLRQHDNALLVKPGALLCIAKGIATKPVDGYIALSGQGLAFLQVGGASLVRDLAPGEAVRVEQGCIAAIEARVTHTAEQVGTLTGPGKIWLQTLRA